MTTPDRETSGGGSASLPFGRRLADWLPDETIFSWCSRYHQMSANGLASTTCLQLFGDRRAGCAHDLPCRIDRFVERTESALGTAEEVIASRTLLPYYWPFRSRAAVDDALAAMRGHGIGSLKFRLGLLTSALDAAHPLKACPSCLCADERAFGVGYWHRVHQLPTVLVCPAHRDPLLVSPMKTQQRSRFQWVLPTNAALDSIPGVERAVRSNRAERQLQALATIAASVVDEPPTSYSDPCFLAETFLSRLMAMGLASSTGRVAWGQLMRDVKARMQQFSAIPGIGYGALHAGGSQASISRLLGARGLTHPTRYLSWVSWYFGCWPAFVTAYEQAKISHRSAPEASPRLSPNPVVVPLGDEALADEHWRDDESRRVRPVVDIALADKAPIIRRRPKKLKGDLRHQLISGLRDGSDKAELARAIGVSIVTVTRVLLGKR